MKIKFVPVHQSTALQHVEIFVGAAGAMKCIGQVSRDTTGHSGWQGGMWTGCGKELERLVGAYSLDGSVGRERMEAALRKKLKHALASA